jgi:hypothetical protein
LPGRRHEQNKRLLWDDKIREDIHRKSRNLTWLKLRKHGNLNHLYKFIQIQRHF